MADNLPWDADCDATKAALERFLRALVCTRSHFTDSFTLAPVDKPARGVSVFFRVRFRVWIPEGAEQRFLELAGLDTLRPPPRVSCGLEGPTEPLRAAIDRARSVSAGGDK